MGTKCSYMYLFIFLKFTFKLKYSDFNTAQRSIPSQDMITITTFYSRVNIKTLNFLVSTNKNNTLYNKVLTVMSVFTIFT